MRSLLSAVITRALFLSAAAVVCCSHTGPLHPPLGDTPRPCAFGARLHEIACGGNRIAHVTCYQPSVPIDGACRALSVEYDSDGAVVWLYKPNGYDPAHPSTFG